MLVPEGAGAEHRAQLRETVGDLRSWPSPRETRHAPVWIPIVR